MPVGVKEKAEKEIMTRTILTLAVLVAAFFISGAAQAQNALSGFVVFTIPGEQCSAGEKTVQWVAPSFMHISAIQIWNGLDNNTQADVTEWIGRQSDGSMLIMGNHDDYVNGGTVRFQKMDFAPNYFALPAGDSLVFHYSCSWGQHGAWLVNVWYW